MPRRVAIHGSYFADNFGDTLLIRICCNLAAARVGAEYIGLATDGDAVEQVNLGFPVIPPSERQHVSHLIYAGGGYFGEPAGDHTQISKWSERNFLRHFSWLNDYPNADLMILGIGVGPITDMNYRDCVRQVFSRASRIIVRDRESLEYCQNYNFDCSKLELGVDLAMLVKNHTSHENSIGLHLPGLNDTSVVEVLKFISDHENLKNIPIRLISDNKSQNKYIIHTYNIIRSLGMSNNTEVHQYSSFDALLNVILKTKTIITTKLHVGIVGVSSGSFVISIPLHQKIFRFYKQMGLDEFVLEESKISCHNICETYNKIGNYSPNINFANTYIANMIEKLNLFLS